MLEFERRDAATLLGVISRRLQLIGQAGETVVLDKKANGESTHQYLNKTSQFNDRSGQLFAWADSLRGFEWMNVYESGERARRCRQMNNKDAPFGGGGLNFQLLNKALFNI